METFTLVPVSFHEATQQSACFRAMVRPKLMETFPVTTNRTHGESLADGHSSQEIAVTFRIEFLLRMLRRLAVAVLLGHSALAIAQSFPERNISLVVPFTVGGITDSTARLVADKLGKELKRTVVVENKPGAGGSIGAALVASAAADGYTLLFGTMATQVVNGLVYKSLPYDPVRDFVAIHGVMAVPLVVVTRPDRPYQSLQALVEAARAKPGSVSYGSPGSGTVAQLSTELFQAVTGTEFLHVPYKGSAPVITDLLGGSIDFAFDYWSSAGAQIEAGKLAALAVTGPQRLKALPRVPTMKELGHPEAEVTSWLGVFAPAGTPSAVIELLQAAMDRVVRDPEFGEGVEKLGGQALSMNAAEFDSFIQAERSRWKPVADKAGLLPN